MTKPQQCLNSEKTQNPEDNEEEDDEEGDDEREEIELP